jgi:single-strand DNA-binding protein
MATNVNRTELTGNLGNDPEQRFGTSGTYVSTVSIAVHTSYKQGEEWKERTDWFRLVAFGESAERLSHFRKGERITVTGRLQSSEYLDREGQKRTSVEVVVLRSEPAPLTRRNQLASTPEVVEEGVEEAEAPVEAPAPKPRRRKKTAA